MRAEHNITRLRVSGGLSQLDGLCQRLATLSKLTVERMHVSEATARGVAWLAAGQPQGWSDIEVEIFKPENVCLSISVCVSIRLDSCLVFLSSSCTASTSDMWLCHTVCHCELFCMGCKHLIINFINMTDSSHCQLSLP